MEFSATKVACQQSPITLNQLWDWIYIGTVALSSVALGAFLSASLALPHFLLHCTLSHTSKPGVFRLPKCYKICSHPRQPPCCYHRMQFLLLAVPTSFIHHHWVVFCSKWCSEEIMYSAVKKFRYANCTTYNFTVFWGEIKKGEDVQARTYVFDSSWTTLHYSRGQLWKLWKCLHKVRNREPQWTASVGMLLLW